MTFTTPPFWYYKSPGLAYKAFSATLTPLSWLYLAGHLLHQGFTSPQPASLPSICIGNLTAGGSGKTPSALMIMRLLIATGRYEKPAFLSRGYGRQTDRPLTVLKNHSHRDVGDETVLLRDLAPAYVAANRLEGLELARQDGADLLILDDGFQNRDVLCALRGLVVNSYDGFGNGRLLPAGPLREPVSSGLKKADFLIYIEDVRGDRKPLDTFPVNSPTFRCHLNIVDEHIDKKISYMAYTGIARPQKFFSSLEDRNIRIEDSIIYPDHYSFDKQELEQLIQKADSQGLSLITTEKDYVKVPLSLKRKITCVKTELVASDEAALQNLLIDKLDEKNKISI